MGRQTIHTRHRGIGQGLRPQGCAAESHRCTTWAAENPRTCKGQASAWPRACVSMVALKNHGRMLRALSQSGSQARSWEEVHFDWHAARQWNQRSIACVLLIWLWDLFERALFTELESLPDVVNDLDVDFSENPTAAAAYKNDQRNIRKVKEATEKLKIDIIHPLRPGKKLLVLDIDYSKLPPRIKYEYINLVLIILAAILDTKPLTSGSLPPAECARPRLHEFLDAIYPYYDICIWSNDNLDVTCMRILTHATGHKQAGYGSRRSW